MKNSNWWEENGELVIAIAIMTVSATASYFLARTLYRRGLVTGAKKACEILRYVGAFENADREAVGVKLKEFEKVIR